MSPSIERLHYYQRQYLGAEDFEAQQVYHRDMRRRHNLGPHTAGIVVGLDIVERPGEAGGIDLFVMPGFAVDGYGREIVVDAPKQLNPALFAPFLARQKCFVYIGYSEAAGRPPRAGYAVCDAVDQYARVRESFEFVINPKPPLQGDIIVGGNAVLPPAFPPPGTPPPTGAVTIPPDRSVPHQTFTDDDGAPDVWLIQLGAVVWDGTLSQFISSPEVYAEGRIYSGAVAEKLYAPAGRLLLSPRSIPADATAASLAGFDYDAALTAEVRGRLQIDGTTIAKKDVQVHGGKLSFRNAAGGEENIPLWMQRQINPSGTGTDLRVRIGDSKDAKFRLSIGPKDGAAELAVLAVKADDTVDIKTGRLFFGAQLRQMINLWNESFGIGIQSNTLYFRTGGEVCWFHGGVHDPNASNPGAGGSLQMRLDSGGRLHFGAATRQMLNLWSTLFGIGVQPETLYFRSFHDFCWFRQGQHADVVGDPGGGGSTLMKLDRTGRLTNFGPSSLLGNVEVGQLGGVARDLVVSGRLRVAGTTNLIRAESTIMAVTNNGQNVKQWVWNIAFAGFTDIYTSFVTLNGFSIFNNGGNIAFNNVGNLASADAIPQHVKVRITNTTTGQISGEVHCSESDPALSHDNTVLFTVVVIGRTAV